MTNVLYVIFNRPHLQRKSFASIRKAKPSRLFIAADGPRQEFRSDVDKCLEARKIVEEVDWACEVKTLFKEENSGCRVAVSDAITWFFRHVDEGIILEDDCVASQSFFKYASRLLDYYRDDHRVWCISGNNFQSGVWRGDASYYFSRYNHCWGWATWRRCWLHYDDSLSLWPVVSKEKLINDFFLSCDELRSWTAIWDDLNSDKPSVNSWALRWTFACFLNGGLTALPNRNLVTNIGYGEDGTHCLSGETIDPGLQEMGGSFKHPGILLRNPDADEVTYRYLFGGRKESGIRSAIKRGSRRLLGIPGDLLFRLRRKLFR